jgi:DNA-binding YbaB/EbfC family protein
VNINPFDVLKNAQKIQEQMGEFQGKLETITAMGSAGGDMVEIDLNGRFEMLAIRITRDMMNPDDVEMLQDLIVAAYTDGMEKIRERISKEVSGIAGGAFTGGGMPDISSLFSGGL